MRTLPVLLSFLVTLGTLPATALAADPAPGFVQLSIDQYEKLLARAQRTDGPVAAWGRGEVTATVPGDQEHFVRVELRAEVDLIGDGPAQIALVPADVVVEEARYAGNDAALIRRDGVQLALVDASGSRAGQISLRYLVPIRTSPEGARIALIPLPAVASSALTVRGAPKDLDIWPSVDAAGGGAELRASLPPTSALVLRWGDSTRGHVIRRVDYQLALDESGDGVDIEARFEVIVEGKRADIPVAASSVALMSASEGNTALTTKVGEGWHLVSVEGKGRHELVVRFRMAIDRSQGQPMVQLALGGAPMTSVEVMVPGKREVTFEPAIPLTTEVVGEGDAVVTTARGHLPPSDQVTIRWTESRAAPEDEDSVNVETYQLVSLEEGALRSKVTLRYEIIRGKVKDFAVELPESVTLYKVSGAGIEDWRVYPKTEDAPRQAQIILGAEIQGSYRLDLELEIPMNTAEEGTPIDIPVVRPLGVQRERGVVALFDGDKVGFAPAVASPRFTKVGEDALPTEIRQDLKEKVNQAYKHLGEPGTLSSKVATAQAKEVRFAARVNTLYLVKEGALIGNAAILLELKSGRLDAVVISLPEGTSILNVTAPSLNKHDWLDDFDAGEGRRAHELRFTQALEGAIQLDVEFETLLPKELGKVSVPDIRVHGADVQEGSLGIAAETGIEVQPARVTDLRQVDVPELPKAVRLRSEREVLFGYTYAFVPWALELEIKRHSMVETLNAIANAVWLETTILEDGRIVTRATYRVTNENRQYLRLQMPEGADVWTVAAGGQQVKAVEDDSGKLAIPLPKGQTLLVDVYYSIKKDELGSLGKGELIAPQLDMLATDIQWQVKSPRDLATFSIDTDMKDVSDQWYEGPEDRVELDIELPVNLVDEDDVETHIFKQAVADPEEPSPRMTYTYVAGVGQGLGYLLTAVGLLLLALALYRIIGRRRLNLVSVGLLVLGAGVLVLKGMGWGLLVTESVIIGVVLVVVIAMAWINRKTREA